MLVFLINAIMIRSRKNEETMKFTDLPLKGYLQEALAEINFVEATE